MNKFPLIIRGCLVVSTVAFVAALAFLILRALWLNRDAEAYIKEEVPRIVSSWNSQTLLDQATPGLRMVLLSPSEAQALATASKLGRFKHLGEPVGSLIAMVFKNKGDGTFGNYEVPAQFEAGNTTILIQVQRLDGRWRINGFQMKPGARPDKPAC